MIERLLKVLERVFEERIRRRVDISDNQMGFMPGRSTVDAIFAVRQLMEKHERVGKEIFMVFIDLEKAFDRVPREVIWWALRKKGVPEPEVRAVMEMYREAMTAVQVEGQLSEWFGVKVGVHQGSVLSPLLFAIVMDALTEDLGKNMREFLYADDVVILGDSWEDVGEKYVRWKEALESKGLKVSVGKTKAMRTGLKKLTEALSAIDPCAICGKRVMRNSIQCTLCQLWIHKRCSGVRSSLTNVVNYVCGRCDNVGDEDDDERTVMLGDDEVEVVTEFCYLGDMLRCDGDVGRAVTARIRAGWRKFRELSNVLCGRVLSFKLKGRLYKACVRSVMCYGAECWAMKIADTRRMQSTEMRMIRLMCGKTIKDRLPSAVLRERSDIEDIEEHLRGLRLRWFGHLERMDVMNLTRRVREETVGGRMKRGRPKKTWEEILKDDMRRRDLRIDDALDRGRWRRRCRQPVDPGKPG